MLRDSSSARACAGAGEQVGSLCHRVTGEGVSGYPVSEALNMGPIIENMLFVQTLNI